VNAPFVVAAVVGHPISHSLSPAMHNDALRRRGVAGTYAAHDVTEESFASFLAQQRGTALRGLSVTMPLKDAAFDLVDNRDEFAQRSRSVNTITFDADGRMRGSDTDGRGCVEALRRFGCDPAGTRCMVLGAGGAARSIVVALDRAGAQAVLVVNRSQERAKEAAACAPSGRVATAADAPTCHVIVNATPVGMALADGGADASPLEASLVPGDAYVLDAVYKPLETRLLREAAARGATTIDGLWMLVHQAALQQAEWFGVQADADAMRTSAQAELARR
jgi:shikimate dehydrogenase